MTSRMKNIIIYRIMLDRIIIYSIILSKRKGVGRKHEAVYKSRVGAQVARRTI